MYPQYLDLHSCRIRTGGRGYDDGRKGRVLGMDRAKGYEAEDREGEDWKH